jgi:hypothetical protein
MFFTAAVLGFAVSRRDAQAVASPASTGAGT